MRACVCVHVHARACVCLRVRMCVCVERLTDISIVRKTNEGKNVSSLEPHIYLLICILS